MSDCISIQFGNVYHSADVFDVVHWKSCLPIQNFLRFIGINCHGSQKKTIRKVKKKFFNEKIRVSITAVQVFHYQGLGRTVKNKILDNFHDKVLQRFHHLVRIWIWKTIFHTGHIWTAEKNAKERKQRLHLTLRQMRQWLLKEKSKLEYICSYKSDNFII